MTRLSKAQRQARLAGKAEAAKLQAEGATYGEAMLEAFGDAPDNPGVDPRLDTEEEAMAEIEAGDVALAPAPKTVVKVLYKHRYQDQAKARGLTDKASRRGNGDWLQRELQAECNNAKTGEFDLVRFEAILDANGIDHSRWNRTTLGWKGRIRMSGSIALRGVVGKTGKLQTPEGITNVQEIADNGDEAARAFLAKWAN